MQPFRLSAFGAVLICPVWRAFVAARMQQDDFLPGWVPSRVICAQHKLKMAEKKKKAERKAAKELEKTAVVAKEVSEAQERKAKEAAESAAVPAAVAAAADETLVRAYADDAGYVTETSVLSDGETPPTWTRQQCLLNRMPSPTNNEQLAARPMDLLPTSH